jgi:UDP:flavonoid glycosyltransferase YjiC (YdhE family)
VAKRTEELGAGIRLKSIAEADILDALKQVLADPEYKNNAIKVSDSFHACCGASEAKAFLEEITG